ncbi:hypothetical protein I3843_02G101500 [Carya illinoinensis]|nr:hypothetical protein I3843_02G101500 [Carya illinoinensis]
MFGISYGELFLLIGATAALVGPKDLPILARTAGRLAGRAIGYVQLARGQFDNVMQQSQARQVHKELQDTMAQLEVIRHEIRGISFINPGPLTRRLMDEPKDPASNMDSGNRPPDKCEEAQKPINAMMKDYKTSGFVDLHSQATAYARLAESAGMLPDRKGSTKGSDIVLEAVLEAEVARNAKDFFSQPQNQIDRIDRDTCTSNHQGLSNNTALKHDGEN